MVGYWYEQTKQHNDTCMEEQPANRVYFTNKSESQKPKNNGDMY